MFKIIEKFFRGFVNQTPISWHDKEENVSTRYLGVETIKENLYQFFDKGWEKIIRCDDGWIDIIAECHSELMSIDRNYKIHQIKEKFGTLRYYCEPSHSKYQEYFDTVINKYECMSIKTCEISGVSGVFMKKDGWYKTLDPTLGEILGYEKCKASQ